jgi:ABC-2 type transport system permease protein
VSAPASTAGWRRYAELTTSLAVTDFKLRYYGNFLGYFWSLLKPLMLFGVVYIAFTEILKIGNGIPHYAGFLVTALVLFGYFSEVTGESVPSLVNNEALLRKLPMPVTVIPLGIALRALFSLALNLVAVFVILRIDHVAITWTWLELPVLVLALVLLTTGISAILATLFVPFRDTSQIWEVVSQVLFWGSGVIYPIEKVPDHLREWFLLNPLAAILAQMHHAVIDNSAPTVTQATPHTVMLLIPLAIILGAIPAAALVYRRVGSRLVEQL